MKNLKDIAKIINNISYKDGWQIILKTNDKEDCYSEEGYPYIQIIFKGKDAQTQKDQFGIQKGRKWFLSYHMTATEIVYTAFKAIQAAEDHEMREFFKYKEIRILNPHFSVDDIVEMVKSGKLNEDSRINLNKNLI